MKKILFFISLLFAVVCFAAPPPDLVPDPVTDQCGFVVQVQDAINATVYTFEAQEVAFVDVGNVFQYQSMFAEPVHKVKVPEALVIRFDYNLQGLSRPPSLTEMQGFGNNFRMNMQNTNYGYPLTGDNC